MVTWILSKFLEILCCSPDLSINSQNVNRRRYAQVTSVYISDFQITVKQRKLRCSQLNYIIISEFLFGNVQNAITRPLEIELTKSDRRCSQCANRNIPLICFIQLYLASFCPNPSNLCKQILETPVLIIHLSIKWLTQRQKNMTRKSFQNELYDTGYFSLKRVNR